MIRNAILALAVLAAPLFAGAASGAEPAPAPLAHCNWGEIGCNNPPPKIRPAVPAKPQLAAAQARAQACHKDLSSGDECWTNCKTEDDITICDIIKLDTFWPEAPGGKPSGFKAPAGKTVSKTWLGKKAIGRWKGN